MISSVRGTVLAVAGTSAVIEVGGVGLGITVTPSHALTLRPGQEATLHTTLIVREDDLSLYGFVDTDELAVFDLLRGVGGVGPKSAMGVLAVLSPGQIAAAIAADDDAPFRKVSGIGPKTAKLIVVSLAGKVIVAPTAAAPAVAVESSVSESVVAALVGLGWTERVAAQAVEDAVAAASATESHSVSTLLRLALTQLGPQHAGAGSTVTTR